MAPLKKPLFVPPPLATLDHFFTKADASINRSASSSFQVPKRLKTGLSSSRIKRKTPTQTPRPTTEIIILDSDDDAPAVRAKRKAKDHSESNSDVEVVETVAHEASSSGKKAKTGRGPGPAFGSFGTTFPLDESLNFAEFGRPKLLIPTEDTQLSPGDEKPLVSLPEDESVSAPLSADPGVPSHPSIPVSEGSSRDFATTSTTSLENPIAIDNEWGTGDDELVCTIKDEFDDVLELTDDDDEVEGVIKVEDEPPSASGDDSLDQCPFCGRSLTSLSPLVSFTFCSLHPCRLICFILGHTNTHQ